MLVNYKNNREIIGDRPRFCYFKHYRSWSFIFVAKFNLVKVRKHADEIPADPNIIHITMI